MSYLLIYLDPLFVYIMGHGVLPHNLVYFGTFTVFVKLFGGSTVGRQIDRKSSVNGPFSMSTVSTYLSVCLSISISIYIYTYIHTSPGYPHLPGPTPPSGLVYQDKAQLGRHLHTIVPRKEAHIEGLASCSRARGR